MAEFDQPPSGLRAPSGSYEASGAMPSGLVWLAALVIVALAAIGAYKGLTSVRAPGSTLLSPQSLIAGKPVEAAPVAPLAHDPNWSTLSGPQIIPPPPAKPAVKAAPKDDEDDSDEAPDAGAAADDMTPPQAQTPPPPAPAKPAATEPPDDNRPPATP
jgi:hypothetical protein